MQASAVTEPPEPARWVAKKKTPSDFSDGVHKKWSQPVSRVLSWTVIRLGLRSLTGSSNLPVPNAGRASYHKGNREPIWSCFGWSLPCHELLPVARCALTAPFHPYLIRVNGHRRFALCCTGRRLAPPRRYLAPCPVKPGLSSPCLRRQRLSGRLRRGFYRKAKPMSPVVSGGLYRGS